jgi:EAL domain-containing protein (putative c-di-GMP-specific phosphodiesterase class I)
VSGGRRPGARVVNATDPLLVMRCVVEEALALIPAAEGAVVELVGGDELTYVCAAGTLMKAIGTRVRMRGSLSGLAVRQGVTLRCNDAASDDRVDGDACLRVGAVSMICLPLLRNGRVTGVLKLTSSRVGAFDDQHVALLGSLATFISDAVGGWASMARSATAALLPDGRIIDPSSDDDRISAFVANVLQPSGIEDRQARRRIEHVLNRSSVSVVLQPIIDLKTGRLAGCEALARFPGSPHRPPDAWFAEAEGVGLGAELQLLALRTALHNLSDLPAHCYLAVNLSPDVAVRPEARHLLETVDAKRIVVELTEHNQVQDYPALITALEVIRTRGTRLAIDDTGAGFAGFAHILRLAPDLIKLDRMLTTGVDSDPARQALAGALVSFATATRAKVVAEGIETQAELDTLHCLGIHYGQGYLLGRPGSVSDLLDSRAQLSAS